jgi:hypothetical protein
MATYQSTVARDQLDQAQAELDQHLRLGPNGCCATCGEVAPCTRRNELSNVFARYASLPRRRPGVAGAHFLRQVA